MMALNTRETGGSTCRTHASNLNHEAQHHEGGVPLITLVLSGALSVGQLTPLEGAARALEVAGE